jgi:hypothetical protein
VVDRVARDVRERRPHLRELLARQPQRPRIDRDAKLTFSGARRQVLRLLGGSC